MAFNLYFSEKWIQFQKKSKKIIRKKSLYKSFQFSSSTFDFFSGLGTNGIWVCDPHGLTKSKLEITSLTQKWTDDPAPNTEKKEADFLM